MTLADPPLAATAIAAAGRIVIKIRSSLLVDRKTHTVDLAWLRGLAADVAGFKADGKQVLVVSSGDRAGAWRRSVEMPISPPKPNSPPSANWVEALARAIPASVAAGGRDRRRRRTADQLTS